MRGRQRVAEPDEKLMQRTSRGDLAAFGELFDRHQPAVYAFLSRFLGNATWAEDVVQEVFWRVWRYRHSFDSAQRFAAWLYGIARHTALTEARRSHHQELSLDQLPAGERETGATNEGGAWSDDGLVEDLTLREQVRLALQKLPPDQRSCLILREYEQRSYQEIAAILECTPENARVLAFRARRTLRTLLEDHFQAEGSCV
jgi:RNA polymerase sigma factor (sigma-70 family)